ncbi:MAG TPA: Ig-like domain-containing protein [Opitutaceae bacterium]|nr:Ig-like domain-containing protein [Opitutaceae bacterium]
MKTPAALLTALLGASALFAGNGQWTVLGWNNLGMHCMDDDYSVFSILPPFNTVDAQLIDAAGKLVKAPAGLTLTYEAIADPTGSLNRSSLGKTNFWTHTAALYGNVAADHGLAGFAMPGAANTPQQFAWGGVPNGFEATGIPISPTDDSGKHNPYPLMRLTARNAAGTALAHADVVLPVSDEMDCKACHASGAGPAARPAAGWSGDPRPARDFRLNVLRLHDDRHAGSPTYTAALASAGYSAAGLFDTVVNHGTPILCARCHSSEALPGTGVAGVPPLTQAMHAGHAAVVAPDTGLKLGASNNRSACYQCHPGSATQCLRGAMGAAVERGSGALSMQCQSCHGTMAQVGAATRTGWLDEPTCQACHTGDAVANSGQIRFTSALDASGAVRVPANTRFATNPDTPAAGHSLYRFSAGHGGLQCSACHGSTHAEFPTAHGNDNLFSTALQGHPGTLVECRACHATDPKTVAGGPHGMHPVNQSWVSGHPDQMPNHDASGCRVCHGTDYKGTVLSRAKTNRSFNVGAERGGMRAFWAGQQVGCYECHNGAKGDGSAPAQPAVPASVALPVTPRTLSVSATISPTPAAGTTLRIVNQPQHGTVGIVGNVVTYYPFFGYIGPDSFTYAATNGTRDSNLGAASVTVDLAGAAANPAGDGIDNLLKYAFYLDPYEEQTAGLPEIKVETVDGARYLTLTTRRNPLATEVAWHVEASSDLTTWTEITDPAAILHDQPTLLKLRDTVSLDQTPRRFLRLRVQKP